MDGAQSAAGDAGISPSKVAKVAASDAENSGQTVQPNLLKG
jgi:hypothetical protein